MGDKKQRAAAEPTPPCGRANPATEAPGASVPAARRLSGDKNLHHRHCRPAEPNPLPAQRQEATLFAPPRLTAPCGNPSQLPVRPPSTRQPATILNSDSGQRAAHLRQHPLPQQRPRHPRGPARPGGGGGEVGQGDAGEGRDGPAEQEGPDDGGGGRQRLRRGAWSNIGSKYLVKYE